MIEPSFERDGPGRRIDGDGGGEQHAHVLLPPENPPDRRGDIAGRQSGRRHLVEQRLEQVVIAAVEQGDADRRALQRLSGGEPAEPSADDHDMWGFIRHMRHIAGGSRVRSDR